MVMTANCCAAGAQHRIPQPHQKFTSCMLRYAAAVEIAGAVAYLHSKGVVHGDLSPFNILLSTSPKDSRRWVAKARGTWRARGTNEQSPAFLTHALPALLAP